jgi:hypothetical protein
LVASRGGDVVRLDAPTGPLLASDDRRSAVALVDERTVITGSVETVAEVMAVSRGLLPALEERKPIAALWEDISAGSAIAAVVEPPEYWRTALTRVLATNEEDPVSDEVEAVGLAVGRKTGNAAEVRVRTFTSAGAGRVASKLAEWVASPPPGVEAPWDGVLRSGEVSQDGRDVLLRVDVTSLAEPR